MSEVSHWRDNWKARAEAAERERDSEMRRSEHYRTLFESGRDKLARVREEIEQSITSWEGEMDRAVDGGHISRCKVRIDLLRDLLAILDGEEWGRQHIAYERHGETDND